MVSFSKVCIALRHYTARINDPLSSLTETGGNMMIETGINPSLLLSDEMFLKHLGQHGAV